MDYGLFNGRTDINVCGCTRGFTDTVRESALKVDSSRKKSLAAPGNRTCVGSVPFRCSTNWATSPTLGGGRGLPPVPEFEPTTFWSKGLPSPLGHVAFFGQLDMVNSKDQFKTRNYSSGILSYAFIIPKWCISLIDTTVFGHVPYGWFLSAGFHVIILESVLIPYWRVWLWCEGWGTAINCCARERFISLTHPLIGKGLKADSMEAHRYGIWRLQLMEEQKEDTFKFLTFNRNNNKN